MKHLVCLSTGHVTVSEVAVPELQAGDILVQMKACGICGTDLMKVYDPSMSKPVQLGHEIVGVVAKSRSPLFNAGQRVAVAHHAPDTSSHYAKRGSETQDPVFKSSNVDPGGFAEFIRVPSFLVPQTVHSIPDAMPDLRALFMEPLACCIRALNRSPVAAGDTVLLVGAGAIGLLFVPLLVSKGVKVIAVDIRKERLELAQKWGATDVRLAEASDITACINAQSGGRGADLAILTSVSNATLALAMDTIRDGGSIIPFGVKPNLVLPVDMWQLYRREISIVTSYSATPSGLAEAMALLASDGFALETTISNQVPINEAAHAFEQLNKGLANKVAVTN
jgi:L-iditol 2-dehydrogenase